MPVVTPQLTNAMRRELSMDVALGTHVYSSDQQDLGAVDRLILDPATGKVKAVVVRKGFFLPDDVEIPLDALAAGSDGAIRVPYSADQLHTLPRFQPGNYTEPPLDYVPPVGYPVNALYWPLGGFGPLLPPAMPTTPAGMGTAEPAVSAEVRAAWRREDLENAVIDEGSAVMSRDEQKVGEVHRLTFDPASGMLTHVVVRKGFIFSKDTELPASLIADVDDGVIYLSIDADDQRLHDA